MGRKVLWNFDHSFDVAEPGHRHRFLPAEINTPDLLSFKKALDAQLALAHYFESDLDRLIMPEPMRRKRPYGRVPSLQPDIELVESRLQPPPGSDGVVSQHRPRILHEDKGYSSEP